MAAALIAVAACSVQTRSKQQFAGKLHAPNCPETDAALVIQDGTVLFTPDNGTWILSGRAANGQIQAAASRPGVDHHLYVTELKGTMTDTTIQGSYTTPSCNYTVDLTRF